MSSGAGFSINDLLRRKLQTGLIVATLTLSVASTLSLLFFSSRLSLGIARKTTGTLTLGLNAVFSQFIIFESVLILVVGAVLTSFIIYLMMAQRTRDFGLIKAAGCPNALVAGYFMTELLSVTVVGCVLGVVFGFLGDFTATSFIFSVYTLPNFWFAPLVFVVFLVLSVFFGLQPLLKASRMSPIRALSPVNYYGLTVGTRHKAITHSALSWRLATRSLVRRQSATLRVILLLSLVFILLTISVAGGIIASETTTSWIQETTGPSMIVIAHKTLGNQYQLLLSKFSGVKIAADFNYSDPKFAIPHDIVERLQAFPAVNLIDSRLVLMEHVHEIGNFTIDPDTLRTIPVGGTREGDSLVIGVEPKNLVGTWSIKGRFLDDSGDLEAVIGDSISQSMYSPNPSRYTVLANPLLESISLPNAAFPIVGVCVDPINNGFVTYVPLKQLQNATNVNFTNLILIKISNSVDRAGTIQQIQVAIQAVEPDLKVFDINSIIQGNSDFLASTWKTIMLLPLFTLASAAFCLVGYMMLTVNEQQQEFAVLRAVGAKSRLIVVIAAIQSSILLFSSFGIGLSLGTIVTLLILMTNPLITIVTVMEISVWLIGALLAMILLSLYPAFRISKSPILKIMVQ